MMSAPRIVERPAQPYVARRTQVTMQELGPVIPQLHATVYAWLGGHGIAPAGAPFIRYRVIDMQATLDIELGVPIAQAVESEAPFVANLLPAGRYATLIYTDVSRGVEANKALLDWGAEQGLAWDSWPEGNGDGFGARLEIFLSDPKDEPDPAKWETEVAIRLADGPAGS